MRVVPYDAGGWGLGKQLRFRPRDIATYRDRAASRSPETRYGPEDHGPTHSDTPIREAPTHDHHRMIPDGMIFEVVARTPHKTLTCGDSVGDTGIEPVTPSV
jgi:hypothetical protein